MKINMKKLLEFLEETNGQFSSKRLFTLLVVISTIVDWMHQIWMVGGIWEPSYQTIAMVLGVLGFQVLGSGNEQRPDDQVKP